MAYDPYKRRRRMAEQEQPIQSDLIDRMNQIGSTLDKVLAPYGFALLVFQKDTSDGRMNYISNCELESMLVGMKEFIAKCEHRHDETDVVQ